eukprot:6184087-Pleurochrysis_carterae.AAC.1
MESTQQPVESLRYIRAVHSNRHSIILRQLENASMQQSTTWTKGPAAPIVNKKAVNEEEAHACAEAVADLARAEGANPADAVAARDDLARRERVVRVLDAVEVLAHRLALRAVEADLAKVGDRAVAKREGRISLHRTRHLNVTCRSQLAHVGARTIGRARASAPLTDRKSGRKVAAVARTRVGEDGAHIAALQLALNGHFLLLQLAAGGDGACVRANAAALGAIKRAGGELLQSGVRSALENEDAAVARLLGGAIDGDDVWVAGVPGLAENIAHIRLTARSLRGLAEQAIFGFGVVLAKGELPADQSVGLRAGGGVALAAALVAPLGGVGLAHSGDTNVQVARPILDQATDGCVGRLGRLKRVVAAPPLAKKDVLAL